MDDREMVAALAAGDPDGPAGAYDAYAESLYGYCRWMLAEPGHAAEVVQSTFALAAAELGGLRDSGMVRTWLFTTARSECLRRPRAEAAVSEAAVSEAAVSEAAVSEAAAADAEQAAGAARVRLDAERAELRKLILGTLATLTAGEREAVQLSLWHDMDETDLATVLSVSWPRASDLVSSGQRRLESTLGALRIARTGRTACPELGTLLADQDGPLTVPVLGLVSEHIEQCAGCGDGKRGTLRPEALTRLLPLPAVPAGLREQVLAVAGAGGPAIADNAAIADNPEIASNAAIADSPDSPEIAESAPAALTGSAGVTGLDGLARRVRTAEVTNLAMRTGSAGWNLVRRSPRVTIAAAAMLVAVAACVSLITANDADAARNLAAQSAGGTAGASARAGTNGTGTTASPGTGRSPGPGRGGQASPAPANFLAPSASSPGKVTPSKSPRPRLPGSPPPSASASSSPSASDSDSASPAPTHKKSPPPTPTPTPTPTSTPTPSPNPSSSATPTDTPT